MAGETALHADAMAAVLSLLGIAGGPGALEQHHMAGPLQAEAQAAGPIGGNQQARGARLKGIDGTLTLVRRDLTGEQLAAEPLLQQLGRSDKTAEQHHRFPPGQQLAHQGRGRRQFVVGADLA